MKKIIVGYTGFVGSNICKNMEFDGYFNSKNITQAYDTNPDLLVYTAVKAEKYMANLYPQEDMKVIDVAKENIKRINPKTIILISTIDVYKDPNNKDEDYEIEVDDLEPYGLHRYMLEQWVKENFENHLIIRLPALFGINIKKNFLYDLKNPIPQMLKKDKYNEIYNIEDKIGNYYYKHNEDFYKINNELIDDTLYKIFKEVNFSALNFTDSSSVYQFLNLDKLASIINIALKNNINILNASVEPVSAGEVYKYIYNSDFVNNTGKPCYYNYKTKYYKLFNGKNGYIYLKKDILKDIKNFVLD